MAEDAKIVVRRQYRGFVAWTSVSIVLLMAAIFSSIMLIKGLASESDFISSGILGYAFLTGPLVFAMLLFRSMMEGRPKVRLKVWFGFLLSGMVAVILFSGCLIGLSISTLLETEKAFEIRGEEITANEAHYRELWLKEKGLVPTDYTKYESANIPELNLVQATLLQKLILISLQYDYVPLKMQEEWVEMFRSGINADWREFEKSSKTKMDWAEEKSRLQEKELELANKAKMEIWLGLVLIMIATFFTICQKPYNIIET